MKKQPRKFTAIVQSPGMLQINRAMLRTANLDVGDVIVIDTSTSGVVNIRRLQENEELPSLRDGEGIPIPPGHLIQPFTGNANIKAYLQAGEKTARALHDMLSRNGFKAEEFENILDFGCGSARVLRAFRKATPAKLHGCDLHKDAIDWNNAQLPFGTFFYGTEYPPLEYPDNHFDFLYAISVLTHLDEEHQDRWLKEWHRVLKPGGAAILSYRGRDFIRQNIVPKHKKFAAEIESGLTESNGICFKTSEVWKNILPDYYANTYHTDEYVRSHWGQYFEVQEIVAAGGLGGIKQNAAVLRKN